MQELQCWGFFPVTCNFTSSFQNQLIIKTLLSHAYNLPWVHLHEHFSSCQPYSHTQSESPSCCCLPHFGSHCRVDKLQERWFLSDEMKLQGALQEQTKCSPTTKGHSVHRKELVWSKPTCKTYISWLGYQHSIPLQVYTYRAVTSINVKIRLWTK